MPWDLYCTNFRETEPLQLCPCAVFAVATHWLSAVFSTSHCLLQLPVATGCSRRRPPAAATPLIAGVGGNSARSEALCRDVTFIYPFACDGKSSTSRPHIFTLPLRVSPILWPVEGVAAERRPHHPEAKR